MWESPSSSSRLPVVPVSVSAATPVTSGALALTLATLTSAPAQSTALMAPTVHANEIWRYITKCRQLMVWVLSDDDNVELRGAMFPALSSTPVSVAEIKQLAHLYHNVVLDVCPWIVHSRSYLHVLIDEHESFEHLAQAVDAAIIEACRGGSSAVSTPQGTPRASWHRRSVAEVLHPVAEESSAGSHDADEVRTAATRSPDCTTARLSESTGFEIRTPPLEAFGRRHSSSYTFSPPHDPDEVPLPVPEGGAQMQLWESESEREPVREVAVVPAAKAKSEPQPETELVNPKSNPAASDANADVTELQLPAPVEIKIHPASVVSLPRAADESTTPTTLSLSPPQSAQTFPARDPSPTTGGSCTDAERRRIPRIEVTPPAAMGEFFDVCIEPVYPQYYSLRDTRARVALEDVAEEDEGEEAQEAGLDLGFLLHIVHALWISAFLYRLVRM
ncbi:uncharacterized protein LOC62_05G007178 [Vanrija pseudolonga]|uniref:Uncharacterized protein n=1 Tax=Vanrija pseudolonga TaxID=143232 RepID=A0AAF0YBD2_9TREE|nr:hypothetical protein LOC62_05G007178 [Vanrija pseudolonga]